MQHKESPSGSYLVLEPSEWADDIGISELARRAAEAATGKGIKIRLLGFHIGGKLKLAIAVFPEDQEGPAPEQVERARLTCSHPDYPGFDSITCGSAATVMEGSNS